MLASGGGTPTGSVHQKKGLEGGEAGALAHHKVGLGGAGTSEGAGEWGAREARGTGDNWATLEAMEGERERGRGSGSHV